MALADLYHFQLVANPTYSLVLLDDAAKGSEVDTAWHALVRALHMRVSARTCTVARLRAAAGTCAAADAVVVDRCVHR